MCLDMHFPGECFWFQRFHISTVIKACAVFFLPYSHSECVSNWWKMESNGRIHCRLHEIVEPTQSKLIVQYFSSFQAVSAKSMDAKQRASATTLHAFDRQQSSRWIALEGSHQFFLDDLIVLIPWALTAKKLRRLKCSKYHTIYYGNDSFAFTLSFLHCRCIFFSPPLLLLLCIGSLACSSAIDTRRD